MMNQIVKYWTDDKYFWFQTEDGIVWKSELEHVWPVSMDFGGDLQPTMGDEVTIESSLKYNDVHS